MYSLSVYIINQATCNVHYNYVLIFLSLTDNMVHGDMVHDQEN